MSKSRRNVPQDALTDGPVNTALSMDPTRSMPRYAARPPPPIHASQQPGSPASPVVPHPMSDVARRAFLDPRSSEAALRARMGEVPLLPHQQQQQQQQQHAQAQAPPPQAPPYPPYSPSTPYNLPPPHYPPSPAQQAYHQQQPPPPPAPPQFFSPQQAPQAYATAGLPPYMQLPAQPQPAAPMAPSHPPAWVPHTWPAQPAPPLPPAPAYPPAPPPPPPPPSLQPTAQMAPAASPGPEEPQPTPRRGAEGRRAPSHVAMSPHDPLWWPGGLVPGTPLPLLSYVPRRALRRWRSQCPRPHLRRRHRRLRAAAAAAEEPTPRSCGRGACAGSLLSATPPSAASGDGVRARLKLLDTVTYVLGRMSARRVRRWASLGRPTPRSPTHPRCGLSAESSRCFSRRRAGAPSGGLRLPEARRAACARPTPRSLAGSRRRRASSARAAVSAAAGRPGWAARVAAALRPRQGSKPKGLNSRVVAVGGVRARGQERQRLALAG